MYVVYDNLDLNLHFYAIDMYVSMCESSFPMA